MNHLQHSRSPYLRQHANNPVDWYPWGGEALALARRTDRPVLVSIGYSTCHWCHVMERESFTDPAVAEYMNEHFVNIKIDREERPDLDQLYMEALQVLTGQSGWPLQIFLTPELRPFYGGTYFPPEPDGRKLSWFQALQFAAYNFYENRSAVEREADRVEQRLRHGVPQGHLPDTEPAQELLAYRTRLLAQVDRAHGGFGQGRKFPNFPALDFLLRWHYHHDDTEALLAVQLSTERMLWSGTYDLVGGGLMRYSTLPDWSVPHFEKMLYDNALLIRLLADLYRVDGNPQWAWFLRHTVAFLQREMALPGGGFAAALDADSGGREGGYYTWTLEEWQEALPDGEEAGRWFDLTAAGNWDGTNTLHPRQPLTTTQWTPWQQRLLAYRAQRPAPARDDKAINSWNSLLLTALVHAWEALGDDDLYALAHQQRAFIQQTFPTANRHLLRINWHKDTYQPGFLEDYTFFAEAMLTAYRLDYDESYLAVAKKWMARGDRLFALPDGSGWYSTSQEQEHVFLRKQAELDEELPAASVWFRYYRHWLAVGLDQRSWRWPIDLTEQWQRQLQRPDTTGLASWASLALAYEQGLRELAITGLGARQQARQWMRAYHPDLFLMAAGQPLPDEYPLLQHRHHADGALRFYLCRDYACRQPVKNPDALRDIWTDL